MVKENEAFTTVAPARPGDRSKTLELSFFTSQYNKEKQYWQNKLSGEWEKTAFPYDYNKKKTDNHKETGKHPTGIDTIEVTFPAKLYSKIITAVNQSDHRLLIILIAGLQALLHKYTGNKDIIIGIPIEKQRQAGEYINTALAIGNQVDGNMTYRDLLMQVRQTVIEAADNQNYPIETIPHDLNMQDPGTGDSPLFDVSMLLKNIHDEKYIQHIKTNLVFSFIRTGEHILCTAQYNRQVYRKNTIERIQQHYIYLLQELLFNADTRLSAIGLLSKSEARRLLYEFNKTGTVYPREQTIQALFQRQAKNTPWHTAVKDGSRHIAYKKLNETAAALSCLLKEKGLDRETIAAVMGHRSLEMMIIILAILKAGGAYLPINAQDPGDRIKYILKDSSAHLLITPKHVLDKNKDIAAGISPANVMISEDLFPGAGKEFSPGRGAVIESYGKSIDLAYIIYTSGTTGKPKGVIIEQRSLVNYTLWAAKSYIKEEKPDFPFYTSFSFDMSITSIFTPLITGGTVVVYGGDEKAFILEEIIADNRVEIVKVTPAHLKVIRDKKIKNPGIKRLLVGGENLETLLAKDISENFPGSIEIYNEYGPTEATVGCMIHRFDPAKDTGNSVPIGVPAANARIYLLGPGQNPVPPGICGELHIAGDGLARGYINNPALTAKKFNHDSSVYQSHHNEKLLRGVQGGGFLEKSPPGRRRQRLYKTGDLARWLPGGIIEFLGRKDHQVKIRGFRIELTGIATKILEYGHPAAVVIDREDDRGDRYLCAYVVTPHDLDIASLRSYLSEQLPDYMIPAYFVKLEELPLTPGGKLDRKRLPEPGVDPGHKYAPPRNHMDTVLVRLWSELLNIEENRIGIDLNFFEIGGHSLNASVFVLKLNKEFHTQLNLAEVFRRPSIRELSDYLLQARKELFYSIAAAEKKEYYPASSVQTRLYVLQQLNKGTAYNIPAVVILEGEINRQQLENTLAKMICRHDTLRTSFTMKQGEVRQQIHAGIEFKIDDYEVEEPAADNLIDTYIKPFDLSTPPLFRVGLIRTLTRPDRCHLVVDMHHIISDGGSVEIFFHEFMALYEGQELNPLTLQYKDYSQWQNSQPVKQLIEKQEAYWLEQYKTPPPLLHLTTDFQRPAVQSFEGNVFNFALDRNDTEALKKITREKGVTIFMMLFSLFNILLSRLTGQEDIIVGTPTAGRGQADLQKTIGMFVNTLAIRTYPQGDKKYHDFLPEVKERIIKATENQDYHFENLVAKVVQNRDVGRNPLFDVMFMLDNIQEQFIAGQQLTLERHDIDIKIAKFDLTLMGQEKKNKLSFTFEYCTKLFKKETIERFAGYFKQVLSSVTADPGQTIASIEMIPAAEKQQILEEFNTGTTTPWPAQKTICQWFEEQVHKTPQAPALVFGENHPDDSPPVTYSQLNRQANKWARSLQTIGFKTSHTAGIMMERSVEMVAAVIAILKAGGIYVPIDPGFPGPRIQYLAKDTNLAVIVSTKEYQQRIPTTLPGHQALFWHWEDTGDIQTGNPGNLENPIDPAAIAYIIYTSGSTGKPKGTPISHRSVNNYANWFKTQFGITTADRFCFTGSFCFDMSVTSIIVPLLSGAAIYTVKDKIEQDPDRYSRYLAGNKISIIKLTPTQFKALVYSLEEKDLGALRWIILGGEALDSNDVRKYLQYYPQQKIVNEYGPTEATVASIFHVATPANLPTHTRDIPIGRPIFNTTIQLLDYYLYVVPIGVVGEICISGAGVAPGYINRPQLTAERFCLRRPGGLFSRKPPPWTPRKSFSLKTPVRGINTSHLSDKSYISYISYKSYFYRTGDLGRWQEDGKIQYLGRKDTQVKVRGYRIELGEIEAAISTYAGIRTCAAAVKQDLQGNPNLVAYIVLKNQEENTTPPIREYLNHLLPEYMIPQRYIILEKLPIAPSGKIDREKLPAVSTHSTPGTQPYQSPGKKKEKILAQTWQEVLGTERIGLQDNFFQLGGDSIKAIQAAARMNKAGYKIEMKDIFRTQTLAELALLVKERERIAEQTPVSDSLPLTPIQQTFFQEQTIDPHHYNQAVMLDTKERFTPGTITTIFNKIQQHHDALRMTYKQENGQVTQTNHGPGFHHWTREYDIKQHEHAAKILEEKAAEIQANIDLENGPLMKTALFHLDDSDRLLIVIHHLVIDGVSWRILMEDIETLYRQYKNGEPLALPLKTDSFKLWSENLTLYANSPALLKEKAYWKEMEKQTIPAIKTDFQEKDNYVRDLDTLSISMSEEETRQLLTGTNQALGTEINDILLTALGLALDAEMGVNPLLIMMEGHGREEIFTENDIDIKRTVGWYTSLFPVILDFTNKNNINRQIKEVKETLRHIPHRGIGYGILKYITAPEHKTDIACKLKPEIKFNYIGQIDEDLDRKSFTMAKEPVGPNQSSHRQCEYKLQVSGITANKQLTISITSSKKQYKPATIQALLDNYKKQLSTLISYCAAQKERELTPSDLTYPGLSIEKLDQLQQLYPLEDIYLLSPTQEGILFHALENKTSSAYFVQISYHLHGELQIPLLKETVNQLAKRHGILRTLFIHKGFNLPLQIVLKERDPLFHYEDLRGNHWNQAEKLKYIEEFNTKDRQNHFDLEKDVLMRMAVIRLDETDYRLTWSFHHILMDGWATAVVHEEFYRIYNRLTGSTPAETAPPIPYRTYIRWLEQQDKEKAKTYWRNLLAGYKEGVGIPGKETPTGAANQYQREEFTHGYGMEKTAALMDLAAQNRVTISVMLQTIWGIILAKYNDKRDVVFGLVVSGRPTGIDGVESMVGLFINTIPVRITYDENTTITGLLQRFQQQTIDSEPHHHYPLVEIQSLSILKQHLIDHFLTFLNYPLTRQIEQAINPANENTRDKKPLNTWISGVEAYERSNYDLDVLICLTGEIEIKFRYNTNIYDSAFMKKMALHIEEVMAQMLRDSHIKITQILISHDRLDAKPNIPDDQEKEFLL